MEDRVLFDGSFQECNTPCPDCGNDTLFYYKKVGQHIGAYCVFCDTWLEWVKQWTEKNWDKHIKERALYRCERCGKHLYGREAHAHHKLPKWFMPSLRFDVNNGICLCTECHKQIHGKNGTIKEKENK